MSIGLAISDDGGRQYQRFSQGPLLDRSHDEPYFNTAPYVLLDEGIWKMWYVSCTGWTIVNKWPEPFYDIKHATSMDGIHWRRTGKTCIGYDDFTHAIGKPCVYKEGGLYKMIYSYRNSIDYRTDPKRSYRLGYAESSDGVQWHRKDNELGIEFSREGWDSNMNEYSTTYIYNGKRYLVYNGSGFGESGFGYALKDL